MREAPRRNADDYRRGAMELQALFVRLVEVNERSLEARGELDPYAFAPRVAGRIRQAHERGNGRRFLECLRRAAGNRPGRIRVQSGKVGPAG